MNDISKETKEGFLTIDSVGRIYALEGIDGSGKTSAWEGLKNLVESKGEASKYVFTREPGGTKYAEEIRKVLKEETVSVPHAARLALVLSARQDHLEKVIIPAILEGKTVIVDRFNASTRVYQYGPYADTGIENKMRTMADMFNMLSLAEMLHRNPEWKEKTAGFSNRKELLSQYDIYLRIDVDTCIERITKRNGDDEKDVFDTVDRDKIAKRIALYDKYVRPVPWFGTVVDTTCHSPEEVVTRIYDYIQQTNSLPL